MSKGKTDEELLLDEVTETTDSEKKGKSERKYNSFNLNLKINDPNEEQIYDFLISIGNKRSQLIIHAVEEFIDKYNLQDYSKPMVQLFLKEYTPNKTPVVSRTSSVNKPVAEEEKPEGTGFKEKELIDSSLLDKAKAQLSLFGVT